MTVKITKEIARNLVNNKQISLEDNDNINQVLSAYSENDILPILEEYIASILFMGFPRKSLTILQTSLL